METRPATPPGASQTSDLARLRSIAAATGIAGLLTVLWVALTMETGLTYHLFPAVIAAAPGYWLSWLSGRPPVRPGLAIITVVGLGFVAAGWLALELAGSAPTATFVEGQPGGIHAETVVFALLGAFLGARAVLRADGD